MSFGGGSHHRHHHHHHHAHSLNYGAMKTSNNPFCCDKPGAGPMAMVESPNFNSGSEFKIKSGSKYYHVHNYHFGAPNLNGSGLSTSKYFEKAAFKTSYFSCLSTSSKKNEEAGGSNNNPFLGVLDISPPLLHKSVSCFDPIVPSFDFSVN